MLLRIQQGEYGPVRVVEGEHAGRVGYYDDDEGALALVYFGEPCLSESAMIRRSWLRMTDVIPLGLEKWKRRHPELVKEFGVP